MKRSLGFLLIISMLVLSACQDSKKKRTALPPSEDDSSSSSGSTGGTDFGGTGSSSGGSSSSSSSSGSGTTVPSSFPDYCGPGASAQEPVTIIVKQRGEHGDFSTTDYFNYYISRAMLGENPLQYTDVKFRVRIKVLPDPRTQTPTAPYVSSPICGRSASTGNMVFYAPYSYLNFNVRVPGTVPAFERTISGLTLNTYSETFTINPALRSGPQEVIITRPTHDGYGAGYCSGADCFTSDSNCWSVQLEIATDCTRDF